MENDKIELKEIKFGKCPFLKIKKKYKGNLGFEPDETIEEDFKDCLGFNCIAFRYNKMQNGIEIINCLRLRSNNR